MKKSPLTQPKIKNAVAQAVTLLTKQHGKKHRIAIHDGVTAAARVWDFKKDDAKSFVAFCARQFVPPGAEKTALLLRLDRVWRTIAGNMTVIRKETRAGLDIADAPLTPAEELLGAFSVGTHLSEDYRTFKIAPLVQLNFGTDRTDIPTTRDGWVARRLSEWGREAVPAELMAIASRIGAQVDRFVSGYNLYLHHIDFGDADLQFPADTRLVSHWGLRDYMMQQYDQPNGLKKQRAILGLMRRVVDGDIPALMLDNPHAQWNMAANTVTINGKTSKAVMQGPLRWENFQKIFHAYRTMDPYTRYGNMIDTKFLEDRELPEKRVRKILTDILGSPVALGVKQYLEGTLARALEPFDIYFKRFGHGAAKAPLPFRIGDRYPTPAALQAAIPGILRTFGFSATDADFIGAHIRVDNSRSAGHAWSPGTQHDLQLLRVRVPANGVDEIEFGTYMHELGHCVEGVLSSFYMDYQSLWGVPNSALTEAFAFTFQDRADEILGRARSDDTNVITLQRFWEAFEIAGPSLVEIDLFHWLYAHPSATPAQIQRAIREIGDAIWKKYHAKIFGKDGCGLLSVYSHILWSDLYLADYPLGYVAAYQIRRYLQGKVLGEEMPRICKSGRVYPDQWMKNAVGSPIDTAPLLADTATALKALGIDCGKAGLRNAA